MESRTQREIVEAYKVLNKICQQNTSLATAAKAFKMRSALTEQWKFQGEQEEKIFGAHDGLTFNNGSVSKQLPEDASQEDADKIREELMEIRKALTDLSDMIVEVDITPFIIPANENLRLSGDDLAALDGFVKVEV